MQRIHFLSHIRTDKLNTRPPPPPSLSHTPSHTDIHTGTQAHDARAHAPGERERERERERLYTQWQIILADPLQRHNIRSLRRGIALFFSSFPHYFFLPFLLFLFVVAQLSIQLRTEMMLARARTHTPPPPPLSLSPQIRSAPVTGTFRRSKGKTFPFCLLSAIFYPSSLLSQIGASPACQTIIFCLRTVHCGLNPHPLVKEKRREKKKRRKEKEENWKKGKERQEKNKTKKGGGGGGGVRKMKSKAKV